MVGIVYHARPISNDRFCKVGMTNGRSATERVSELNGKRYAGFSDWSLVSEVWVEDSLAIEKSIHDLLQRYKVPFSSEVEVFVVSKDDVEAELEQYKRVPVQLYRNAIEKISALEAEIASIGNKTRRLEIEHSSAKKSAAWLKEENNQLQREIQKLRSELAELRALDLIQSNPRIMSKF